MYPIRKSLLKVNPYTRPGTKLSAVKGIVIHWTANENQGADDVAHYRYFNGNAIASKSYASAHYFVDHDSILQVLPDNEVGYHVGASRYVTNRLGSYPNGCTIGIETCVNYKGAKFEQALDQSAQLAAHLLKKHGLQTTDLYRHYDVTGKDCPRYFVNNATAKAYGLGSSADKAWKDFVALVAHYMNPKPVIVKPTSKTKLGVATMLREVDVYAQDKFGTGIGKTLKKGEVRNIYDIKRGFYQTFDGTWLPSGYGKNFDYVSVQESKPEEPADVMYRVVTGSFSSRENANLQVDKLKAAGMDSFLLAEGKMFRVITGSFGKRENANERIDALRKKGFESFIALYRK